MVSVLFYGFIMSIGWIYHILFIHYQLLNIWIISTLGLFINDTTMNVSCKTLCMVMYFHLS